jgi:hypothetical protein
MRQVRIKILLPECVYKCGIWLVLLYRRLRYGCAFRIIPLSKGLVAIVSPEDYDRLSKYKWYANKCGRTFYAQRNARSDTGRWGKYNVSMHREIMGVQNDMLVDHQNHNGLDNRCSNLRIATIAENGFNRQKTYALCTSRFKGVSWDKKQAVWRVQGRLNGKQTIIGCFDNELDAAMAYDEWAKKAFGQFAALNFPEEKKDPLGDRSFWLCYAKFTG